MNEQSHYKQEKTKTRPKKAKLKRHIVKVGEIKEDLNIGGDCRKAHLLEDKQIPSVGVFDKVFSTWMAFGGNTRDLGSFGEETNKITDLHQIHEEVLLTERGDGVASIKRRRRHLFSDGVWKLKTASGRDQLKEDLESST
ncbi:hypothetical protein Tco_0472713 [Tanacetum coccineum]